MGKVKSVKKADSIGDLLGILEQTERLLDQAEKNLVKVQEVSRISLDRTERLKEKLVQVLKKQEGAQKILAGKKRELLHSLAEISILFGDRSYDIFNKPFVVISQMHGFVVIYHHANLGRKECSISDFVESDLYFGLCNAVVTKLPSLIVSLQDQQNKHEHEANELSQLIAKIVAIGKLPN